MRGPLSTVLRDEAVLMLAHINIPQRFRRWLPGYFRGGVQFVRHQCTTMMTTPVNEVSETSSKTKSICCLLYLEEKLAVLAVFFFFLFNQHVDRATERAKILLYLWIRKCLPPLDVNIVSDSLAPSRHINMHREMIDIFLSGPPG